jgi:glutamine synthetase
MKFTCINTLALFACAAQCAAFTPLTFSRKSSSSLNAVLGKVTGQSSLDPAVIDRYNALPFPADVILAEYVWVDADGATRSKTRTLPAAKVRYVVLSDEISIKRRIH